MQKASYSNRLAALSLMILTAALAFAQPGQFDASFSAPAFSGSPSIWSRADGRLVILAGDSEAARPHAQKLFLLSESGAIDPNFQPNLPSDFTLFTATMDNNGNMVVAGDFGANASEVSVIRLLPTGAVDATYKPPTLPIHPDYEWSLMLRPSVSGGVWLTLLHADFSPTLTLIGAGGAVERTIPMSTNVLVRRFEVQGTNVIMQADFISEDIAVDQLARLLPDGSLDPAFKPPYPPWDYEIDGLAVDVENRILVAGYHYVSGIGRQIFWRLLQNGAIDPGFEPVKSDGTIYSMALQPDGKIVVRGVFSNLNGVRRPNLARLNTDGTLDRTFNPTGGAIGTTDSDLGIVAQPDGRMVTVSDYLDNPPTLIRFWGDKFLRLDELKFDSSGLSKLTFTNTMNRDWVLEKSADLKAWEAMTTNSSSAVEVRLEGVGAGASYFRGILR